MPLVVPLAIAWLRVWEAGADRLTAVLVLLTRLLLWPRAVLALAIAIAIAIASGQAVFVEEVTALFAFDLDHPDVWVKAPLTRDGGIDPGLGAFGQNHPCPVA